MKLTPLTLLALVALSAPAFANVIVKSPTNGETVSSPATFEATGNSTTCSGGVGSMGIYIDNQLEYVVNGTSINTSLSLKPGNHNAVLQAWDKCGGATKTAVPIKVVDSATNGVFVTSPANNATIVGSGNFVATATTSCAKGVSAMGVYVNNQRLIVQNGASLNASLNLPVGKDYTVIEEWDGCGGAATTSLNLTVDAETPASGSGSSGSGETKVVVTSPANNSTIVGSASFLATATTSCSKGISKMGVSANGQLLYTQTGAQVNDPLNLPTGTDAIVVEAWDNCGGTGTAPMTLIVNPATPSSGSGSGSGTTPIPSTANTFTNLQKDAWLSWGQEAPLDNDCAAPCPGDTWSMQRGISSPSLSGDSTEFSLGGTKPYSDVLFYNQLIGTASTQGLPDSRHTLIPTLHNFVYSTDVYVTDAAVTQALEFDVNMFLNGYGMTFGTECRLEGGNEWDIWDNVAAHWVPTGIACNMINKGWNHISLQVSRDSNYNLTFQSITLNGNTAILNKTYAPFSVPSDWYGVVCDWQMDGDYAQHSFSTYLDNTTFTYW